MKLTSMRAELKRLHSPDIPDLVHYQPENPVCFGFLVQLIVGPEGESGEESFDVVVCTPEFLARAHTQSDIVTGRHHLVVFEYNYHRLLQFFKEQCRRCSGQTWQEVAVCLGRLGKWEFEDYRPHA